MSTPSHALQNENKYFDVFKYNKYMALYPFNDAKAFKEWLDINHLTHDEFLALFDKSNKTKIDKENCPWMDFLLKEYQPAKNIKDKYNNHFGVFIDFIIKKATADFSVQLHKIENQNNRNINPNVFTRIFSKELITSFLPIITPTLTLELNVARVSNLLIGDTPEKRYSSFIDLLQTQTYKLQLFEEYPILWEKLLCKTNNAISQSIEFYQRLCNDYYELEQQFGSLGTFKGFTGEKGDDHNNGRSVKICQFENLSIVYKPRSLKADIYFQKLLLDLNKSANTSFKTFYSIDKGDYGWCEQVLHKECQSKKEFENYYLRMGYYVALLYLLNSSDFHFENVISHGEYPMLIDLESLFHINFTNSDKMTCDSVDYNSFVHTVLDSMLLPNKSKFIGQEKYTDISAIGYIKNKTNNNIVSTLLNDKRDNMSLSYIEKKSGQLASTPSNSAQLKISKNTISNLILNGFKEFYLCIMKNKGLFNDNVNLKKMYKMKFRCIVRATNQYAVLIKHSNHPDCLRSYSERLLYITQKLWVDTINSKWLSGLCYYEYQSIASGNIPIFKFIPRENHIYTGNNRKFSNILNISIKKRIQEFKNKLSKKDLYSQMWIIKSSMLTKNKVLEKQFFHINKTNSRTNIETDVFNELINISLQDDFNFCWVNLDKLITQEFSMSKSKDLELFDGNHGALLFLAYFATIHNNKNILNKINFTIDDHYDKYADLNFEVAGGISGISGFIYGLSKLFQLTKNTNIPKLSLQIANRIKSCVEFNQPSDIIDGTAGQILCFIAAYKSFEETVFIQLAINSANRLKHLYDKSQSLNCFADKSDEKVLGGFSHGVSGIAYALLRLKKITMSKDFDSLIEKCIEYEDQLFDSKTNNYRDLRGDDSSHNNHSAMTAWCHGIVGIGLSRIEILRDNLLPQKTRQFETEIERNIKKILQDGFGDNHSLCHGDAGSLEYLYQVSEIYPHIYSKKQFKQKQEEVLSVVSTRGLKNGVPFNNFYPGLFMGSIGLAYQVLRFKHPKTVKNILLLN